MNILYSITAHEESQSVLDLCYNLFNVGNASYIIIHINRIADDIYMELQKLLSEDMNFKKRIFLNPERSDTSKNQYTLHLAHLSNYNLSIALKLEYDYFILEASNSLFVKKGVLERIKKYDIGIGRWKVNV